jgi:Transketolase, C-terminal domain
VLDKDFTLPIGKAKVPHPAPPDSFHTRPGTLAGRIGNWTIVQHSTVLYAVQVMREGKDLTLISFGKLVGYNLKAAEILAEEGIDAEVGRCFSWTGHVWGSYSLSTSVGAAP